MKAFHSICLPLVLGSFGLLGACTHTPPGTSVEIALAKRGVLVRGPYVAPPPTAGAHTVTHGVLTAAPMPSQDKTEMVADAFARGKFCMEGGKDEEAIQAFQEVVKIDPTFVDAWNYLAAIYEKTGQDQLAMAAFKKSKYAKQ